MVRPTCHVLVRHILAMVSKKNLAPGTGRNTPRQSKMGHYAAKEMTGKNALPRLITLNDYCISRVLPCTRVNYLYFLQEPAYKDRDTETAAVGTLCIGA